MTKKQGLVGDGSEKWHGTISGYTNHKCRCSDCRGANRENKAVSRRKRANKPIPKRVHGTNNGYTNYKCRCDKCRKAHKLTQAEWVERQRHS